MTHEDIMREKSALDQEMLKRRKELNAIYYYPALKLIQEKCRELGHRKSEYCESITHFYWRCGYCEAIIEGTEEYKEGWEPANDNSDT